MLLIGGLSDDQVLTSRCCFSRFETCYSLLQHFSNPTTNHLTKIQRVAEIRIPSVLKPEGRKLGEAFAMRYEGGTKRSTAVSLPNRAVSFGCYLLSVVWTAYVNVYSPCLLLICRLFRLYGPNAKPNQWIFRD